MRLVEYDWMKWDWLNEIGWIRLIKWDWSKNIEWLRLIECNWLDLLNKIDVLGLSEWDRGNKKTR